MLVYLDAAQFDWLERSAPTERRLFFETWEECGCTLALSLHHVQEMAQVEDVDSFHRRLDVLPLFANVAYGPATSSTVMEREVLAQLIAAVTPDAPQPALDIRAELFPIRPMADVIASIAQEGTGDIHQAMRQMRAGLQLGADAENHSKAARGGPGPLVMPSADEWEARLADMDRFAAQYFRDHPLVTPAMWERMRARFFDVAGHIRETGSVRDGLMRAQGVPLTAATANLPQSDIPAASVFFASARALARSVIPEGAPDERGLADYAGTLVEQVSPYRAPGYRLTTALRRAYGRIPNKSVPGNTLDSSHVAFAPYVDLLVVDKHTADLLRQESARHPTLLPREDLHNITRVRDLGHAAALIRATALS